MKKSRPIIVLHMAASSSSSLDKDIIIISRNNNAAKTKALVQDWRAARDRALALFDVCIDVIARVPVLGDKKMYPPLNDDRNDNDDGKEESRQMLCTQTLLKQMEQLGNLLEKMDRERDALKRSVDDMEKAHKREATKAAALLNNAPRASTSTTTALMSCFVKKGGETTALEVMERIETSWRFYAEETSACEVLLGLCREAAATALAAAGESKKSNKYNSGEEMVRSARAFLEVRKKVELER